MNYQKPSNNRSVGTKEGLRRAYSCANSAGMDWTECEENFIRSRKLGVYGALRPVKERTIEEYKWDLKHFFEFMRQAGITHYNQLSEKLVLDYVLYVQTHEGWSPATVRKLMISLRAFLKWVTKDPSCRECGMQSFMDCMPRIGKAVRRLFVPSREQMQTFLNGFDRNLVWGLRDYTACVVMLDTGARIGEICNLEEDDFKWTTGMLNLFGKTGEHFVPISADTINVVKAWRRVRTEYTQTPKLFVTRYNGECTPRYISASIRR